MEDTEILVKVSMAKIERVLNSEAVAGEPNTIEGDTY